MSFNTMDITLVRILKGHSNKWATCLPMELKEHMNSLIDMVIMKVKDEGKEREADMVHHKVDNQAAIDLETERDLQVVVVEARMVIIESEFMTRNNLIIDT